MTFSVQAAVLQFPVTMDVAANIASLAAGIERLPSGVLAIAPEGALSGYQPRPGFVTDLDTNATAHAVEVVRSLVANKRMHLVVGACVFADEVWRNASFYLGPQGQMHRYDKVNLAQSERGTFTPGNHLPVFEVEHDGGSFRLGIQMCREIRYPEQWRLLASRGAQVIAYVNNAVGSTTGHEVWRAHMISRAAETQRFVVGANNAAADQTCPSMIVAPSGAVLAELRIGVESTALAMLPISEVSDWVISQARADVVFVGPAG